MRMVRPAFAAIVLAGCAPSAPPPPPPPSTTVTPTAGRSSSTAADLAFDPPIAARGTTPDLSRGDRGPTASNGTVQSSTTTFNQTTYVGTDTDDGAFNQQSVTQKTGTVSR